MNIKASIQKATTYLQNGQYNYATAMCEEVLLKDPGNVDVAYILARIADRAGRYEESARYLEQVQQVEWSDPQILLEYGRALRLAGQSEEAVRQLRNFPGYNQSYDACRELGLALVEIDELAEAESTLSRAIELNPNCWFSSKRLGSIAQKQGRIGDAIVYFKRVVEIAPNTVHSYPRLIRAYLSSGDPESALTFTEKCLQLEPACTGALALKYIALFELGDTDAARYLCDNKKYVKRIAAECPPSFISVQDFNDYLENHILTNTDMVKDPKLNATKNGWHSKTGKLFENNKSLGKQVGVMINCAVDEYISQLPADPNHPVNKSRPTSRHISEWAVVMEHGGQQIPHIHAMSWLSGVFYIQLPDDFDSQPEPDAGYIMFGQPEESLYQLREPETMVLKPTEGDFVIFPSCFWHQTVPLLSQQKRICMAFDVVPTKGWGK